VDTAPAERYALVIRNHGGGWIPDGPDALYEKVRGLRRSAIGRQEANHLATTKLPRVLFTPTLEAIASLDSARDRMIASDDGTGHSLDTIEVQRVLEAAAEAMGQPIDLFGMDACLMSTLEVAYQVRATSRVVAGSEELEPEAGWCYDEILRAIADQPESDGAALGTAVVNRYVESYQDQTDVWPVTQAAVDTARIDQFAATVGRLAGALRAGLPGAFLDVYQARANAVKFDFDQVDLRTFCRELLGRSGDAALRQAAQGVVDALAPGGYVLAEGHLGATVEESGGISVYFPEASSEISKYYADLAFAADHHWDEFLAAYHTAARG
jgi:Clostripain family